MFNAKSLLDALISAGSQAGTQAGQQGSLGGMLLPWLQGNLLARGGPSASTLLVAAGTVAMLALHSGRGLIARASVRLK